MPLCMKQNQIDFRVCINTKKIMKPKELLDLAETFGNPLYVYDAEKIETQYNRLTNAFKVEKDK